MRTRLAVAMCGLVAGMLAVVATPAASSAGLAELTTVECTVSGTSGPDVLTGSPGDDVICGRGGDDQLIGRGGDDVLLGGRGDDRMRGGPGDDRVHGQRGDDVLRGGQGADRVAGGHGDDLLRGNAGSDTLDSRDAPRFRDTVRCGGDTTDVVHADPTDVVSGCNAAPVAVDDAYATVEDIALTLSTAGAGPAGDDTDANGDPLTVIAVARPTGGTVSIVGAEIRFRPTGNLCAPASAGFDYAVTDGRGGTDTGRVTVSVSCVDDAPEAVDDAPTVAEDSDATSVDVLGNDTDVDGGAKAIDTVTQPANGAVVITGGGTRLTYEPSPTFCSATPDTFTYTLTPGGDSATVSVTVTCVDDPPTAADDMATVGEDSAATAIDVLANDADADAGPMAIDSVTPPDSGTVLITGGGTGLTYEPDPNFCSATADTFDYTLAPGGSTATVSVTVTCVDDPPTAVDDPKAVVQESGATTIDVLANDVDDGGPMSIVSVTQPSDGTVLITGGGSALTYQPDLGFCGTTPDTFTYTLNGGDSATVRVTVACFAPAISTSLSATPGSPAINESFRYDARVANSGNVPLDVVTMTFNVPIEMSVLSVTTGTYTGFSELAPGEGARVFYEKNTAPGVFTLWGSSPNTSTNTTLTAPPPGLGAGEYLTRVRWAYGQAAPGAAPITIPRISGRVVNPDNAGGPVMTGDSIQAVLVAAGTYAAGPTDVSAGDAYTFGVAPAGPAADAD